MRSRLVLGLAVVLAACSGGGGSSTTILPSPPWGNFRQNNSNGGANGLIDTNTGTLSLPVAIVAADGVTPLTTLSTPTIDLSGNVLIATKEGIRAYAPGCFVFPPAPAPTPAGQCPLWTFNQCSPPCSGQACPSPTPVTVGSVSASPSVTAGGTVVVGSDGDDGNGRLFAFQESGTSTTCLWVFPSGNEGESFTTKSSAATMINSDLTLAGAFVGSDDGLLRALNPDGTVRWSYSSAGPISSSPALDSNITLYVTTDDGKLAAINFAGQEVAKFPFLIGTLPGEPFQPSPATITTSTYAIGSAGTVYAISPDGSQKWSPPVTLPLPPSGSPAFLTQSFNVGPTLTFDTIVYVVDVEGTAYGLRDLNGSVVKVQRCSNSPTLDCMTDSCLPGGGICGSNNVCVCVPGSDCTVSGVACTPDSCLATGGICQVSQGIQSIPGNSVPITTSPAVSGDPFVVVGTTEGQVCARNLDGTVPGQDLTPPTLAWETGCINLPKATKSSPIIGVNGVIYVTTGDALYAIQ
jgi:outer membrane protein assembly factor BamB